MEGLIIALLVLMSAAALVLGIRQAVLAHRLRGLTEHLEDFLNAGGEQLGFSVHEDKLAPLHNAVAELENQLMLARERETEQGRRTSHLTADLSHQLKTPLASLRLFCEMDGSAHMSQQIGQIERMERLIYSILRLEKLCANGYEFTFAERDVGRIVEAAWESLKNLYPERRLIVQGDARIRCDEKWLGEAFLNLLKNACEHTRTGGKIWVSLEITQVSFFCAVRDDGGGVKKEDLPHLFERFYRTQGQEKQGVGIGLSIVREIIRRHHGDIYAENAAEGLKMVISIPILNLAKS